MKRYYLYNPTNNIIKCKIVLDKTYKFHIRPGERRYLDNFEYNAVNRHQIYKVWKLILGVEKVKPQVKKEVEKPLIKAEAIVEEVEKKEVVEEIPVVKEEIIEETSVVKEEIVEEAWDEEEVRSKLLKLTKVQLLEYSEERGLNLSSSLTKTKIIDSIMTEGIYGPDDFSK